MTMHTKTNFWIAGAIALLLAAATAGAADWKPAHSVEIVVPFAAGGGNDVPARIIQKIMTDEHILEVPSTVVNKPGGGGAVGLQYLNQHAGDGQYLSIISTSTLTSYIIGTGRVNYTDLTPIVPLITEYIAFAVSPESSIKSFGDLVSRMKADPTGTSFAVGGGLGNPNHVAMAAALKAAGVDVRRLKAVAFGGGKEAMTAVMGNHVDVLSAAASVLAGQQKGGKLRVLAVAAPHRLAGDLASIPTLKEQGVDVVFGFSRYIVGPRGLAAPQIAYWDGVFAKVVQSPEWKAAVAKHDWVSEYAASADTRKELDAQYKSLHAVLTDLGMAKAGR
jgi:putative tricarboxylic transport membrane protein